VNERSPRSEGAGLCPKDPQRSPSYGPETRRIGCRGDQISLSSRQSVERMRRGGPEFYEPETLDPRHSCEPNDAADPMRRRLDTAVRKRAS